MSDFCKKDLFKSLFFPVLITVWGALKIADALINGGSFSKGFLGFAFPRLVYFPQVLGGALAIILTLACKIHTERYFIKQIILAAVLSVIYQFIMSFGAIESMFFVCFVGLVYQVVRIHDEDTTRGERAVMILSDLLIYDAVYYLAYWVSDILLQ